MGRQLKLAFGKILLNRKLEKSSIGTNRAEWGKLRQQLL